MRALVWRNEIRRCKWEVDVPEEVVSRLGGDEDGIRLWAFDEAMQRDEDESEFIEYENDAWGVDLA